MPDRPATAESATRADRIALLVTDLSSPALVVVATLVAVAWHSAQSTFDAVAAIVISVFFVAALPYAYLQLRLRKRTTDDRHVQVRSQRQPLLRFGLVSTAVGVATLIALDAPRQVLALVGADVAGLAVVAALTRRWKLSMHTAVASGAVVIAALTFGWSALVLAASLVPISWARLRLRHHSAGEVMAGILVGATVAGAAFEFLR